MSGAALLPSLAITALSPLATGAAFCRLAGVLWATVVVKASFQLVPGETARLVAPIDLVREDRTGTGSAGLESARETAPYLPNAGVVLTGHACAPEGRAVPSMSVRLGLSRERPLVDKTIHVFGARAAANPDAIAPFQKMPLVHERARGGAGNPDNPVGTGEVGSRLLPNLVDPKDPRKVACFGPIARTWAPRRALLRGLDPAVVEAGVWDVPAGFDWRFFQAAPADQQCDRLHGDEWIVLDGMDPALPRVQSRLPLVTALARRQVISPAGAVTEQAIELRADTLVIDADQRRASLIWRGRFAVESAAALERTRVLAGLEMPGRALAWPAPPAASREAPKAPQGPHALETQEVNLAAILGEAVPFFGDRESAAPGLPAAAGDSSRAAAKGMFTGTETFDLRSLLKQPVPFAAPEAGRPPAVSVSTAPERRPAPMFTGTADINLAQVLGNATPPVPTPPVPTPPVPTPPVPTPPVPTPPVPTPPVQPLAAPAAIARRSNAAGRRRKDAEEKLEKKESFDGESYAGANLSALDFSGRSLVGCDLRGAILRGAVLRGAKLGGAKLDGADLRGAVLEGADLCEASLVEANLERAKLAGCRAEQANLRGANLLGADMRDGRFAGAELMDGILREATAERADFTGARFDRSDVRGASLRSAKLAAAVLAHANLEGANLQNADLRGANLHEAIRRMTRLAGADLTGVDEEAPAPLAI